MITNTIEAMIPMICEYFIINNSLKYSARLQRYYPSFELILPSIKQFQNILFFRSNKIIKARIFNCKPSNEVLHLICIVSMKLTYSLSLFIVINYT
jgi:hypothetical protein